MQIFIQYLFAAVASLIVLSVHECSHAYVAYKLGDPTAKSYGRLTVNPLKHLDPLGVLCLIFFHFGWAKPVPINARYFKKPRRDFALTALAGPFSNLLMAFFSAFLYLFIYAIFRNVAFSSETAYLFVYYLLIFILIFHQINLGIAVFNLIPIPPLDGSRILNVVLPTRTYFRIMQYEKFFYWIVVIWLIGGRYLSSALLSIPFIASTPVLNVLARLLSLSYILSYIVSFLSEAMLSFWQLIPFLAA